MQVRHVPFLHELGKLTAEFRAACSKGMASDATNLHPLGSMRTVNSVWKIIV
ncbi:hypothetical protein CFter6_5035 [Collimonas fungivorans]|uniref:Uncharacterized protein n=1 Tax=Collimonas fungivorans TaxID=158899 RepID=A0A127PIN0_9BURK|nr:hypothetical protein CFter6_5035 [Collimonas fungivorans]